jgi:RHS repeat-associated protein
VVAVTDASGAVIERRFYDDFGNAFDESKLPVLTSAVGNPYGFQGRRLDSETGLYYFRNRYYSTETGRFLQRDPVWDAGNFGGQYSFAWNGPISRGDAWGLQGVDRDPGIDYYGMPDPPFELPKDPEKSTWTDPVALLVEIAKSDSWIWKEPSESDYQRWEDEKIEADQMTSTNCKQFLWVGWEYAGVKKEELELIDLPVAEGRVAKVLETLYMIEKKIKPGTEEANRLDIQSGLRNYGGAWAGNFKMQGENYTPKRGDIFIIYEKGSDGHLEPIHTGTFVDKDTVVHSYDNWKWNGPAIEPWSKARAAFDTWLSKKTKVIFSFDPPKPKSNDGKAGDCGGK